MNSITFFSIGLMKDLTKNYVSAFITGGIMIIIASYFHFALSCVKPEREEEQIKEVHV
jgi:hypothetical protein